MKGFVPTPDAVVDLMVGRLFAAAPPRPDSLVLDPGCGPGAFVAGVLRWCTASGTPPPRVVGVEMHPERAEQARARFQDQPTVSIHTGDFLGGDWADADYVIGNPPYVPITALSTDEKTRFRAAFETAHGRFDLYALFFEQALRLLRPEGRLVFVTPEKYLSVDAARPLRRLLARRGVREVVLLDENVFGGLVTYPAVTVVGPTDGPTRVTDRDGARRSLQFTRDGAPLTAALRGHSDEAPNGATLGELSLRVSCGVATGADAVFVRPMADLPEAMEAFAYPTVAGRQLVVGRPLEPTHVMLTPYDTSGWLLPEGDLGPLGKYLGAPQIRRRLEQRSCVRRKPWYAFHETPPLGDLLRPKLLCKDIADRPRFWVDLEGTVVPRHSVYYIVPRDPEVLPDLAEALNSEATARWLRAHAQPAANGYRRLQSRVLKQVPVPSELVPEAEPASVTPSLFARHAV